MGEGINIQRHYESLRYGDEDRLSSSEQTCLSIKPIERLTGRLKSVNSMPNISFGLTVRGYTEAKKLWIKRLQNLIDS